LTELRAHTPMRHVAVPLVKGQLSCHENGYVLAAKSGAAAVQSSPLVGAPGQGFACLTSQHCSL